MRSPPITSVIVFALLASSALLLSCHSAERAGGSDLSSSRGAVESSRAMTPNAQRALRAVSRLSPENTLPRLQRADAPPPSLRIDKCVVCVIETWSQPGVAEGQVRQMVFDPGSSRLWICEAGDVFSHAQWYGPVRVAADGRLISAD